MHSQFPWGRAGRIWPSLDFQLHGFEIEDSPTPIPAEGSPLPSKDARARSRSCFPPIIRNNSSTSLKSIRRCTTSTKRVGPSDEELFLGRLQPVTDKSRTITVVVAWQCWAVTRAAGRRSRRSWLCAPAHRALVSRPWWSFSYTYFHDTKS